ncbi:MAG: hypothetical protein RPR91_09800, partial [Colwellia sp.]
NNVINGNFGEAKWLKVNNVFIALCNKSKDTDDDSELIWASLNKALHDWCPNYYRLMVSEIQNEIEDGNLAMKGYLDGDYESQAAWLWRLKSKKSDFNSNITEMFKGLNDHILDGILEDRNLIDFSRNCIEHSFSASVNEPQDGLNVKSTEWQQYNKTIIKESIEATFKNNSKNNNPIDVIHAINQSISSKTFSGTHITVGTVLRSNSNEYFLCVSPSCDTVPGQLTDAISERMTPNRLLKFLKLEKANLSKAIENATHGKYIFIRNIDEKLALIAVDATTNSPQIDFGIVINHDFHSFNEHETINITFINNSFDSNNVDANLFTPIAQLREAYAARFQALASHHVGRVGVDFIPYFSSKVTPVSGSINLTGHIENTDNMVVIGDIELETPQDLEGTLKITSRLTVANGSSGSRPINITGDIAVGSNNKKRGDMLINSNLEVSSKISKNLFTKTGIESDI